MRVAAPHSVASAPRGIPHVVAMIELELEPSTARLRLSGEFDVADLGRLHHRRADIRRHFTTHRPGAGGTVVLELGGVDFIDCSCLHSLDALRREVIRRGDAFTIATASPAFLRTARLAHFDDLVGAVEGQAVEGQAVEDAGMPPSTAWVPAQRGPGQVATSDPGPAPDGPAEGEPRRPGRSRPELPGTAASPTQPAQQP